MSIGTITHDIGPDNDDHVIGGDEPKTPLDIDSGIRDVEISDSADGHLSGFMRAIERSVPTVVDTLLSQLLAAIKQQKGISIEDASGMSRSQLRAAIVPVVAHHFAQQILNNARLHNAFVIDKEPIKEALLAILEQVFLHRVRLEQILEPYIKAA